MGVFFIVTDLTRSGKSYMFSFTPGQHRGMIDCQVGSTLAQPIICENEWSRYF